MAASDEAPPTPDAEVASYLVTPFSWGVPRGDGPPHDRLSRIRRRPSHNDRGAGAEARTIRRTINTMPIAAVGNDPNTAEDLLNQYLRGPVTATGATLMQEVERVRRLMNGIQPTKAKQIGVEAGRVGLKKDDLTPIQKAANLETFVIYLNGLISDFELDVAPSKVKVKAGGTDGHHPSSLYKFPNDDDAERSFNLDSWSRKADADFMQNRTAGAPIHAVVDEAVADWDTRKGLASLLTSRLLGEGESTEESYSDQSVNAFFMNSAVGHDYTKILTSARHIIDRRVKDLTARGVGVEHWKGNKKTAQKDRSDGEIDWPTLLKLARDALKVKLGNDRSQANQKTATIDGLNAIATNEKLKALTVTKGVLLVDAAQEKFELRKGAQKQGEHYYEALPDTRLKFDLSHFSAILFFEWKLVSDLRK